MIPTGTRMLDVARQELLRNRGKTNATISLTFYQRLVFEDRW
jgi:hypothetical protein